MRRAAAAAGASPAAVKDRELDIVAPGDLGELLLRAVDRPLRGEVAAVLARVGVADHHLDGATACRDPGAEVPVGEQFVEDARGALEIVDRLEQRHDRERLVRQRERLPYVGGGRRAGHDQRVDGPRAMQSPRLGRRARRLARA